MLNCACVCVTVSLISLCSSKFTGVKTNEETKSPILCLCQFVCVHTCVCVCVCVCGPKYCFSIQIHVCLNCWMYYYNIFTKRVFLCAEIIGFYCNCNCIVACWFCFFFLPLCWWMFCSDQGLYRAVVSGAAAAAVCTSAQIPAGRGNPCCWSHMTGRSQPVAPDTLLSRPLHSLSVACITVINTTSTICNVK